MSKTGFLESLATIYGTELSQALIQPRTLPLVPTIQLFLLVDDYPKNSLGLEAYQKLMAAPPYWAFCWGGGQALALHVLANPRCVPGRTVIDFGAGSGVAGVAAALAGAARVICVDIDPLALQSAAANGELNQVELEVAEAYRSGPDDLILAADVCYEEAGMAYLKAHLSQGGNAIIADSRVEQMTQKVETIVQVSECQAKTFPDLDEADCFNYVRLYTSI